MVRTGVSPILRGLAALEQSTEEPERPSRFDPLAVLPDAPGPDWNLVRRHFRR
jgi:hypothetical protein